MKTVNLSLLAFLLPLLSLAQQTINYTLTVDSVQREFILYVPSSYTGNSSAPLVLSYHGLGGTAQAQMDDHDFRPLADSVGFLVAHPQGAPIVGGTAPGWNFGNDSLPDDVLFTSAIIDTIAADYNVNMDRVYACGMSFGGFFSIFLAGQLSDRIASVASVAGTVVSTVPDSLITPERPLSLLQIHGTNDFNVAYNGSPFSQSVQYILDLFITHNNCDSIPTTTSLPDTDPNDGSTVEHIVYANGDEGTVVEHFRITGGGHTWPDENTNAQRVNRDINGCEEIWKFFSRFDMNGAIEVTTSVEPIANAIDIKVYPNPTQDYIHFQAGNAILDVTIINAKGQEFVLPASSSNPQNRIDVSSLPSGLYVISGKTDRGIFQSSFVKR
ncbi:MAG: T9SS type A sorting domain-containing protein [Bacteroidota bacterium]